MWRMRPPRPPRPAALVPPLAAALLLASGVAGCASNDRPSGGGADAPRGARAPVSAGAEPAPGRPGSGYGADDIIRRGPGGIGGGR